MTESKKHGIYIHIPYCKNKCNYCNFVSQVDFSTQRLYLNRLKEEIRSRANGEGCDSVYIGGGTPSVFLRGGIIEIIDCINECFVLDKDTEFTVETNPESCDERFLSECCKTGINRLSIGLQSCDDRILRGAGRLHNFDDFCIAFKKARDFGIKNISSDLILGLRGENEQTFRSSIEKLIDLSPEHISVYALKCEQGTKLFDSGFLPDDDFVSDLYDIAVVSLANSGYNRYEVSNFAKEGYDSRHNIKYWTLTPYFGFGISAHSYCRIPLNLNEQKNDVEESGENSKLYRCLRRANTSQMDKYLSGEFLDGENDVSRDERDEFIMLGLRMNNGISLSEYEKRFGENLLLTHGAVINHLFSQGYINIENNRLKISPKYMYVMNSIIISLVSD